MVTLRLYILTNSLFLVIYIVSYCAKECVSLRHFYTHIYQMFCSHLFSVSLQCSSSLILLGNLTPVFSSLLSFQVYSTFKRNMCVFLLPAALCHVLHLIAFLHPSPHRDSFSTSTHLPEMNYSCSMSVFYYHSIMNACSQHKFSIR